MPGRRSHSVFIIRCLFSVTKISRPVSRSGCVFICLLFSEPMTAEEHTENQRSPVTCSPVICYLIAAKLR